MSGLERKNVEAKEAAFFNRYYEAPSENPTGWRLRMERELRSLRRSMSGRRPGRVLSVGCGDGQFELMLAEHVDHLTALDISRQAIDAATRNAARSSVTNVDFRCLPMSDLAWDDQYDCIVCLAFLHHVPEADIPGFLGQAYLHTAPGGFFYSQDPNVNGVLRKVGRLVLGSRYDQYHSSDERELDPAALVGALRAAGFASATVRHIDLTLIPASIMLKKRAGWPLHVAAAVDGVFCASPLAQWSSGFAVTARK